MELMTWSDSRDLTNIVVSGGYSRWCPAYVESEPHPSDLVAMQGFLQMAPHQWPDVALLGAELQCGMSVGVWMPGWASQQGQHRNPPPPYNHHGYITIMVDWAYKKQNIQRQWGKVTSAPGLGSNPQSLILQHLILWCSHNATQIY